MGAAQSSTVLEKLGEGNFGVVYKVNIGGKTCALKKLKKGSDLDRKALQREIDTLKACSDHDNIVTFFNAWMSDDGEINIQLEYCDLGTLNDYMIKNGRDEATMGSFMLDMARGIRHLHEKDIVHRDLKPDNILLASRPSNVPICKIADFGLARFTFPTAGDMFTNSYTYYMTKSCGIPLFMAPEMDVRHYTQACDIFSLGLVFYLMHSLQQQTFGSKILLCPLISELKLFKDARQEDINGAVTRFVPNGYKATLVKSMLALAPGDRPTAVEVESRIYSYEGSYCNLV